MGYPQFTLSATLFNKRVPEITADLTFPATADDMRRVLAELDAESVAECEISKYDCGMSELVSVLENIGATVPMVDELNWLALKLGEITNNDRFIFAAVLEAFGLHCSVADMINLADNPNNLNSIARYPDAMALGEAWYTEHSSRIDEQLDALTHDGDVFALFLEAVTETVNLKTLGAHVAESIGYTRTSHGYINVDSVSPVDGNYHDKQDIPESYWPSTVTADTELTLRLLISTTDRDEWLLLPSDIAELREFMHETSVNYRNRDFECPQLPSLEKHFPDDANIEELNYLMVKLRELSDEELDVFQAAVDSGRYGDNMVDIVNLAYAENLRKIYLQPVFDPKQYGEFRLDCEFDERYEQSEWYDFLGVIAAHVDCSSYGKWLMERENGVFTDFGYLTESTPLETLYHGAENIPSELRLFAQSSPAIDGGLAAISSEAAKSLTAGGNVKVFAIDADGTLTTLNPMDALNAQLWKSGFTFAVERADLPIAEELQRKIDASERGKTNKINHKEER